MAGMKISELPNGTYESTKEGGLVPVAVPGGMTYKVPLSELQKAGTEGSAHRLLRFYTSSTDADETHPAGDWLHDLDASDPDDPSGHPMVTADQLFQWYEDGQVFDLYEVDGTKGKEGWSAVYRMVTWQDQSEWWSQFAPVPGKAVRIEFFRMGMYSTPYRGGLIAYIRYKDEDFMRLYDIKPGYSIWMAEYQEKLPYYASNWHNGDFLKVKQDGSGLEWAGVQSVGEDVIAAEYDPSATYSEDDYVMHDGDLWLCREDDVTGEWDSRKWEATSVAAELASAFVMLDNTEETVETVEKLKKDLDTQISMNFDMPNISQVYDFADPSLWGTQNGACMLYQAFTIPINHAIRTVADDPDTPTLFGIYAQQNFGHKIMLALYEYSYPLEGEEYGSSTYVGDTGPVSVLQGVNEFPLKNRNPGITELRSDRIYYAALYLPSTAFVTGLKLAGCPGYGNLSVPAEPRLTCATENITWQNQELDMDDQSTTLNLYQVIEIPGKAPYYQYYIGPWNGGYNERQSTPRFYLQIRNGEFNERSTPTAPFETLGDSKIPMGGVMASNLPNFSPSSNNSGFRDVTPLTNVTITAFEWIDSSPIANGWEAGNCVFSSDYSTNLSGTSNTVTDLGQAVSNDGKTGYAHRVTFTTPIALTAGVTYRFLCTTFTSGSDWIWSWTEPTDVFDASNNGWYVDWSSNVTRYSHIAGQYNKLYDSNNNHYVI